MLRLGLTSWAEMSGCGGKCRAFLPISFLGEIFTSLRRADRGVTSKIEHPQQHQQPPGHQQSTRRHHNSTNSWEVREVRAYFCQRQYTTSTHTPILMELIGVASYWALGNVPPTTYKNLFFFQFTLSSTKSDSCLSNTVYTRKQSCRPGQRFI